MKKKLSLILITIFCFYFQSNAQFGNEWIIHNQQYFKFKVYQNGIYRIPISNLYGLGLPFGSVGSSIQIYRDGIQIPIFVSSNSVLASTDYIEFYGEKAKGNLDKRLYADTTLQLNPNMNLTSDTAYYFITLSENTNKRFQLRANTISGTPTKEEYLWRTESINYRTDFARGESSIEGQYQQPEMYTLNSSQYEQEGYVKRFVTTVDSASIICINPYSASGAPNADFKTRVVGKSFMQSHEIQVMSNNVLIADSFYKKFNFTKINASIPMSNMNSTNNEFKFKYVPSGDASDRYGISSLELRYPSTYNLNNATSLYFELNPKASNYYLEITNFNKGTVKPILYDLSSNEYLIGDTAVSGIIRFLIPASTTIKKLFLQNGLAANYKSIVGLEPVTFKNYSQPTNQGNYIIISDARYTNDGNGNNYVNDYKVYRSSAAGGGYVATAATLQDIYNEFGYGYDFSTLAVKNFLNYAYSHPAWSNKPQQILLIGKGLEYYNYLTYKSASTTSYPFYAMPTFGQPGSDWLFTDFNKNSIPLISIGRISAFSANDINNYLQKVKDYESVKASTVQTSAEKLWQKRVLHIGGISDSLQSLPIRSALEREKEIIDGPSFGANTTVLNKSTNADVEFMNNKIIDSFMNNGSSIVYFFGHSSASTIDYGLDFPEKYTNYKKYPLLIANGCGAGNIFIYTGQKYLSERYIFSPNAGAIGFIGSVNTGFSGNLGLYTDSLYGEIANTSYGKTIGEQMRKNINNMMINPYIGTDFLFKMHTEQILLDGDPAIKLSSATLPDYSIELKDIVIKNNDLSAATDSLDVEVTINNLGKYITDSVQIEIKRTLPDLNNIYIVNQKFPGFGNSKIFNFKIPTFGNLGAGTNKLVVTIDKLNLIPEIKENNNTATKTFTITNTGIIPVYPVEYSIVSTQGITLKANTLNAFETSLNYIIQIDTTAKFNSPLLQSTNITSIGGVLNWQPTITYQDSVVYYWRSAVNETNPTWKNSSFIFINNSISGWNQSHYFQFLKDTLNGMELDSTNRKFEFVKAKNLLQVQNVCLNGPTPYSYIWPDYFVKVNGSTIYSFGCDPYPGYSSLQFIVIDSLTGKPWVNKRPDSSVAGGMYGSYDPCRIMENGKYSDPFFEFSFLTTASRKSIMDFIDIIPSGYYIMIQPQICVGNTCGGGNKSFINNWKSDTTTLGANNSLYHKLKNMGFTKIDSFTKNKPMIFWTRKNDISTVKQVVGKDSTEKLFGEFSFDNLENKGDITSTKIGPAANWIEFKRSLLTCDIAPGDKSYFEIYGIDRNNKTVLLSTVLNDTSLAFISAQTYPYLYLKMYTEDDVYRTPEQLKYWRIYYQPVPEGAINPAKLYSVTDGNVAGTKIIKVAFENITNVNMDSVLVKFTILDKANNVYLTDFKRYKPLHALDTLQIEYTLNTTNLFSNMEFQIEVNPSNDQLEQFHPNNYALRNVGIIDPSVPLPVNLTNFLVTEKQCDANLYWTTSEEENLARYEVERKDKNSYKKIADVYPITTADNKHEYFYIDANLNPTSYIYRLKMVDLDEKFKYSSEKTIDITCAKSTEILLFPNPSNDLTSLYIQSEYNKELSLKIIDNLGKTVFANTIDLKKGSNIIPVSTNTFAKGMYTIIINDGNSNKAIKFTKE